MKEVVLITDESAWSRQTRPSLLVMASCIRQSPISVVYAVFCGLEVVAIFHAVAVVCLSLTFCESDAESKANRDFSKVMVITNLEQSMEAPGCMLVGPRVVR